MNKYFNRVVIVVVTLLIPFGCFLHAQTPGKNYALLIGGLGGEQQYSDKFDRLLHESKKALIENFLFPAENITVLAESREREEDFVDDISNADNITAWFNDAADKITENDHVYIILFGHGSFNGAHANFNIPRKDLSDIDFAKLVNKLNANRIIFINTTSSSFPFIESISGENRIVITATKSPTQRNITRFPDYLVEGFSDPSADLDKNGDLSVLEVFKYAAQKTERFFEDNGNLATEHSMIEDTGDRRAARLNELEMSNEGAFADATFLKRRASAYLTSEAAMQDSVLMRLLTEQEQVELDISKLKTEKDLYGEQEYYDQLEKLLVRLARINDQLEEYNKNR